MCRLDMDEGVWRNRSVTHEAAVIVSDTFDLEKRGNNDDEESIPTLYVACSSCTLLKILSFTLFMPLISMFYLYASIRSTESVRGCTGALSRSPGATL